MEGYESNFETISNVNGAFYLPAFSFDGIGPLILGEAYQIYASSDFTIEVDEGLNYDNLGNLNAGINWVAHSKSFMVPVEEAYAELSDLLYISDSYGNTYQPALGINDLKLLRPGLGYFVYLNEAYTDFVYPESISGYSCPSCTGCTEPLALNFDAYATIDDGTCSYSDLVTEVNSKALMHVTFLDSVFINADLPNEGWIISYYEDDSSVLQVGSAIEWTGEAATTTLWVDENMTPNKDGFSIGETPTIIYQTSIGEYTITEFTYPVSYDEMTIEFSPNNYFVVDSIEVE